MTKDSFYTFVIAALAVWRVTHLVSEEEGPWHVFAQLRRGIDGLFRTTAASCFYCASVWIAIPPALWMATGLVERLLLWLALSGAAIVLERATRTPVPAAQYFEHPAPIQGEEDDGMLRKK